LRRAVGFRAGKMKKNEAKLKRKNDFF